MPQLLTVTNRRATGAEQELTETYIVGEDDPSWVFLREAPLQSDVTIPGFTRVHSAPQEDEFRVVFIGRQMAGVEFHPANNGDTVSITYNGRGSPVQARDLNRIHFELEARSGRSATEFATLEEAIAAIGDAPARLILPPGITRTLTADLIVPENITLVGYGGVIETGPYQLYLTGGVEILGNIQTFDTSGGGLVHMAPGAVDKVNWTWYGADPGGVVPSRQPIQAATDTSMYGGVKAPSYGPAGAYLSEGSIHLGYGGDFRSGDFLGAGIRYADAGAMKGTVIRFTQSDRMGINTQGGRFNNIKGMTLMGPNRQYIQDNSLGFRPAAPLSVDDTLAESWVDPALHANAASRYAPCAAVAIEGYSGPQPTPHYPDVDYPAWTGINTQYNKAISTKTHLEEVEMNGWVVGCVVKPSGSDGNADYTTFDRCAIFRCQYGISVCHTQSRNVAINQLNAANVHTILTNNTHGLQNGMFGGTILDMSIGNSIQVFQFGASSTWGPLKFLQLSTEAIWRLGTYTATGSAERAIEFDHCKIGFDSQQVGPGTPNRGIPATIIANTSFGLGLSLEFNGCEFTRFGRVMSIYEQSRGVRMRGCTVIAADAAAGLYTQTWQQLANHALCGGVAIGGLGLRPQEQKGQDIRWSGHSNISTGAQNARQMSDGHWEGQRIQPIPLYARTAGPEIINGGDLLPTPVRVRSIGKASLSSMTLVNRILTLEFASLSDAVALAQGPAPGDVIWDQPTGTVFWVYSRSGTTVLAEQQTNYRSDMAGGYVTITPVSVTTGNISIGVSRIYTPGRPLYGDISNSSATISNAGMDDTNSTWLEAEVAVGDALMTDVARANLYSQANALVTARSNSGGTITLTGNGTRIETHRRLPFWIRRPPDNVEI